MTLNEFLAHHKRLAFDSILAGSLPEGVEADGARFRQLSEKGSPTMGTTVLRPDRVSFEFVYTLDDSQTEVFVVHLAPPERIVHLPVPTWVIESIWQGEVQGSFHFESDARALLDEFSRELSPDANEHWFGKQQPKRRE